MAIEQAPMLADDWQPQALTGPQMSLLSCLYHSEGQLWLGGSDARPAQRLCQLDYAEQVEQRWHRVTPLGAQAFLRLRAAEDTPQGAAARRQLQRERERQMTHA